MPPNTFDRDRRMAVVVISTAIVALALANILFAIDMPYMPVRFLMVVGAVVTIFSTLVLIVLRYRPEPRLLAILFGAAVMFALSLALQLDPVRDSVARVTGLATESVHHVIEDSLSEAAMGLVIIVIVSVFVTASSTTYTANQRAAELLATQTDLLASEERFRRAFEDGPVGMAFADADFQLVRVNRAYCEMLGYSEAELIGKSIQDITHPDDMEATKMLSRAIFGGETSRQALDKRYIRKDGSQFWGRLTIGVVRDPSGKPQYGFGMVANISQRKEAEQKLLEERRRLEALLKTHERERKLTAYEIHDGLTQNATAAILHLESFRDRCPTMSEQASEQFEHGLRLLRNTIDEARILISGLRPPIIDERGIVAAIDYLINENAHLNGPTIEFIHDAPPERLDPLLEGTIYRITQEAVSNVTQHSRAQKAQIKLRSIDGHIELEVRDWGDGFDPETVGEGRFGLQGIRERARILGGKVTIRSAPGHGTCVHVELPLRTSRETVDKGMN